MYALGHSARDTARVLGITEVKVELALDMRTVHVEPGVVVGWLYEHKACCVAGAK